MESALTTQQQNAGLLKSMHLPGSPLVLVNAWDAVSARIVEQAGFPAVATTSAGIAWLEGFADGEKISRERMLAGVERVVRAVRVPVTADLEGGYGPTVEDAIETARGALAAGAVGLNLEDWDERRRSLVDADAQVARIAAIRKAAREAGIPLVINARTDVFLQNAGDDDRWRLAQAIRRANRYLEAGADCAFVPAVTDERRIANLVGEIAGPLNVLAGAGSPSVKRLAELGVARISMGSSAMAYVLAQFRASAKEVRENGTFAFTSERIPHAELNALFAP